MIMMQVIVILGRVAALGFIGPAAVSACLKHCAACTQCRWLTVSTRYADCSWYAKCNEIIGGDRVDKDFLSARVIGHRKWVTSGGESGYQSFGHLAAARTAILVENFGTRNPFRYIRLLLPDSALTTWP